MSRNEDSLSEQVYKAIRYVEQMKKESRVTPTHALLIGDIVRLLGANPVEILAECANLYKDGRITGGNTINDKWFKTNGSESKT